MALKIFSFTKHSSSDGHLLIIIAYLRKHSTFRVVCVNVTSVTFYPTVTHILRFFRGKKRERKLVTNSTICCDIYFCVYSTACVLYTYNETGMNLGLKHQYL